MRWSWLEDLQRRGHLLSDYAKTFQRSDQAPAHGEDEGRKANPEKLHHRLARRSHGTWSLRRRRQQRRHRLRGGGRLHGRLQRRAGDHACRTFSFSNDLKGYRSARPNHANAVRRLPSASPTWRPSSPPVGEGFTPSHQTRAQRDSARRYSPERARHTSPGRSPNTRWLGCSLLETLGLRMVTPPSFAGISVVCLLRREDFGEVSVLEVCTSRNQPRAGP